MYSGHQVEVTERRWMVTQALTLCEPITDALHSCLLKVAFFMNRLSIVISFRRFDHNRLAADRTLQV